METRKHSTNQYIFDKLECKPNIQCNAKMTAVAVVVHRCSYVHVDNRDQHHSVWNRYIVCFFLIQIPGVFGREVIKHIHIVLVYLYGYTVQYQRGIHTENLPWHGIDHFWSGTSSCTTYLLSSHHCSSVQKHKDFVLAWRYFQVFNLETGKTI